MKVTFIGVGAIGLPMALGLLGMPFKSVAGAAWALLCMSALYLPLAIWAWRRFHRATTLDDILSVTLALPALFACVLLLIFGAIYWGIAGPTVGFYAAIAGGAVGYGFVAVSWILYVTLRKMKVLVPDVDWVPEKP